MPSPAELLSRYRLLALAVLASAALHAAVMVGMPRRIAAIEEDAPALYHASLEAATTLAPAPPAPRAAPPRRPRSRPPVTLPPDALAALPVGAVTDAAPGLLPAPQIQPPPEILALAQPAVPVKALEPPSFPVEALPPRVSIEYQLTSAFADGRATYRWEREGDAYRIRGEAQAEGFFTLFLEGQIVQESRGTVGPGGLRPERFSEQRPNAGEEGLTFDWAGRTVTFQRGGDSRTTPLAENTVDWLSMIFQLAHVPPSAEAHELQVFTQRRMYRFRLQVLGIEEIDIPLGRVRALHLRHEDPAKVENVDVWLGVDQHYLPVKLRYPVARNRLMVEQVATRVEKTPLEKVNLSRPQLDAIVDALTVVLPARSPADGELSRFFREHKHLGQKDRALVADTVYTALRRRRLLEHVTPHATAREIALATLVKLSGVGISHIEATLRDGEKAWLASLKALDLETLPYELRADLPDWVIERLRPRLGDDELMELARGLQRGAPLDLRVNTLKAPREAVLDRLEFDEMEAHATRISPIGVRLKEKPALNQHPMFLDGAVEVQDEGSQVLGMLVEPRRGEMVVDFCAGAGGKTLQMGAAMGSTGRLYAFDISDKRLANLAPRLKRSGLSNVFPQRITGENDPKVKRLRGKIDRVLVDAPCTGLGTLRRNPDLKVRQTPVGLAELNVKQRTILDAAAMLLKPGGRLVYGTCSLLAEENEEIVAAFLAAHPDFALVPAKSVLERQGLKVKGAGDYLHLYPHVHDTDGFFAAVLERKK